MTNEEMMAEANAVAKRLVATRQRRFLMGNKELTVLLMDAYARGIAVQADRAIKAFAPTMKNQNIRG